MKSKIILILLFASGISLFSQVNLEPCVPSSFGVPAKDEAPGCLLCGPIYLGNTGNYTPDSINYNFPCGTIENSQWISILAGQSGRMEITCKSDFCRDNKGIEIALYDSDFEMVSNCFTELGARVPGNIVASDLIPGNFYQLMIDGLEGDSCDFLITLTGGVCIKPPPVPNAIKPDVESQFICPNSEVCYSINPILGAEIYTWEIDSLRGTIVSGQGTTEVCVLWQETGIDSLRLTPSNICFIGFPGVIPITIAEQPFYDSINLICPHETIPPFDTIRKVNELGCEYFLVSKFEYRQLDTALVTEKYCFEGTYTVDGTNIEFDSAGQYLFTLNNANQLGCDSIVLLDLTFAPAPLSLDLECQQLDNNLVFQWNEISYAKGYSIFIDSEFQTTTTQLKYFAAGASLDSITNFRVQPVIPISCPDISEEVTCSISTSSVSENFLSENITLLPNPTSGKVQINSPTSVEWIRIFDISGREILHSMEVEVNLSGEAAGVYFFKVKTGNGVITKRVILL